MEKVETKWAPYILARLGSSAATCKAKAGQSILKEASAYRGLAPFSRWQRTQGRPCSLFEVHISSALIHTSRELE